MRTKIPHIVGTFVTVALFGSVFFLTKLSVNENVKPAGTKQPAVQQQEGRVEGATSCAVDAKLVNACRPWVSVATDNYSMVSNAKDVQMAFADKRLNNPNVLSNPNTSVTITKSHDFYHTYHPVGNNTLSSIEKTFINTPGIYLHTNWKPSATWGPAGGGDSSVNNAIDTFANSVKSVAPKKIFLALYHEPENDVSSGNCTSNASGASAGSPAQYKAMWTNVRNRFNNLGVTNVVWTINYMGFSKWNCLVPLLYPGDSLVDWITWDPYAAGTETFASSVSNMYNYLTNNSNSTNNYLSKPWGLAEFGYWNISGNSTQTGAVNFWNQAKDAINNNTYPRLKLYSVFDTSVNGTSQVGYDFNGNIAIPEQTAYNGFVNAILAKDTGGTTPPPSGDTTAPTISFTAPANNASVSGTITITLSASDNVAVTKVDIYVDNSTIIKNDTNASDGWQSAWNSRNVSDGAHTLKAVATDAAGNSTTVTRAITVANNTPPPAPVINSLTASPATVTVGSTSTLSWSTSNTASCSVTPGGPQDTTFTSWQTLTQTSTGTKTYTLTCKNSANATTTRTVNLTVNPAQSPPSNVMLSASATSIQSGQNVSLSWSSTGSTSCTLNPGNFTASGTSSSKTINALTSTTTYKVTCTNTAGSKDSNAVTVTVTQAPPPPANPVISVFTAAPTSLNEGGTVTLTWQASNVAGNGCTISSTPLSSAPASGNWVSGALTASVSYTLTCKNSANVTASKSVSVTVDKAPPPPPPPAQDPGKIETTPTTPSDPIVKTDNGTDVVALDVSGSLTAGMLGSLDTSTITDKDKVAQVQRVEFYVGDELVQTVTEPPFAFDSTGLEEGTYTITQRTYFGDGSSSEESQIVEVKGAVTARPSQPVGQGKGLGGLWLIGGGLFAAVLIAATISYLYLTGRFGILRRLWPFGKHRIVSYKDYDTTSANFITPSQAPPPSEITPTEPPKKDL
jgi:hypothetical protein